MVLVFVLILVLFGGQKLPEFARGLGKSIREFKKAAAGVEEEFKRALEEDERKQNQPAVPAIMPPPATPALPAPGGTVPAALTEGGPITDHTGFDDAAVGDHAHDEFAAHETEHHDATKPAPSTSPATTPDPAATVGVAAPITEAMPPKPAPAATPPTPPAAPVTPVTPSEGGPVHS
jgi:sec-independent protein translocase protein TatA